MVIWKMKKPQRKTRLGKKKLTYTQFYPTENLNEAAAVLEWTNLMNLSLNKDNWLARMGPELAQVKWLERAY